MARPDITGFDPRKLAAAATKTSGDPWVKNEAWRYTGPFTRYNRFKGSFPGLGIATAAFAGYLAYEQLFMPSRHHAEGQSEAHH